MRVAGGQGRAWSTLEGSLLIPLNGAVLIGSSWQQGGGNVTQMGYFMLHNPL